MSLSYYSWCRKKCTCEMKQHWSCAGVREHHPLGLWQLACIISIYSQWQLMREVWCVCVCMREGQTIVVRRMRVEVFCNVIFAANEQGGRTWLMRSSQSLQSTTNTTSSSWQRNFFSWARPVLWPMLSLWHLAAPTGKQIKTAPNTPGHQFESKQADSSAHRCQRTSKK